MSHLQHGARLWRARIAFVVLSWFPVVGSARADGASCGVPRCVTPGHAARLPAFSPDGRWLAVSRDAFAGLAIVDPAGGDWRELAADAGVAFRARWSPRSDALCARTRDPATDGVRLDEIRLDGSRHTVCCTAADASYAEVWAGAWIALGDARAAAWRVPPGAGAAWTLTADGAVAVGATRDGRGFAIDTESGACRWLGAPRAGAGAFYGPVAAPRGHLVVANRLGEGLVLVDLDRGAERALGEGTSPCWLPDGSGIVCEVTWDDGHDITSAALVVVPVAPGAARVPLRIEPALCPQHPAVSPDGAWLAFDTPRAGVFVARLRAAGGAR